MPRKSAFIEKKERTHKEHFEELRKQLPDFALTWLNSKPNLTWSSRIAYTEDLIRFFRYVIDSTKSCSASETSMLTLQDISDTEPSHRLFDDDFFNAYVSYLRECNFGQFKGNNRNSIERKLVPLRGLYLYYSNRGEITLNPLANYARFKEPSSKNIVHLDNDEANALMRAAETADGLNLTERQKKFRDKTRQRDYAIIMLFLGTGIRISECVGADLKDLDFKTNSLYVVRKGSHEDRVFFDESVAEALQLYIAGERASIKVNTDEEPLFYSLHGNRISVDAVENLVKKYTEGITGKHITAHKLRATYGTALYNSTGDLGLVQDALGHSSPVTTKKYYVASREENMKKAAGVNKYK